MKRLGRYRGADGPRQAASDGIWMRKVVMADVLMQESGTALTLLRSYAIPSLA